MSQTQQIKHIITELLSDGKVHTTQEIKEILATNKITFDNSTSRLRNVLYLLKKDNPYLANPCHGTYQLILPNDNPYQKPLSLDDAIIKIKDILYECKSFNWYSCTDAELETARTQVKVLLALANTITKELS